MTDVRAGKGYLETRAETRFSDYTRQGVLHWSKSLMYFEKARFAVAELSGIREALAALTPDAEIAFVVIRVRMQMEKPVILSPDGKEKTLLVRTWLEPSSLCRLTFRQQLVDGANDECCLTGTVDVVILVNGSVMRQFPPEIRACLTDYERRIG
ncbi:MAG: hypothetical protein IJ242_07895 [Clostridia bacterium]|nr:hypothetical protein [Clostridia bacterium]